MNFLLVAPEELTTGGRCVLRDRRARHLRDVLRAEVGQQLRAGVLGGDLGTARVVRIDDDEAEVEVHLTHPPDPVADVLLLAMPRPKVLLRMLQHAAALGFARIVLFRCWRVDKTWLHSRACSPELQREQLVLGLEQAGRTHLPEVLRFDRFRPMVEDHLPALALPRPRFVAHPAATARTADLALSSGPCALAIGPDGGFLPYEIRKLADQGFLPVSCGPHPLRTETALAVLHGQLALLRQRGSLPM